MALKFKIKKEEFDALSDALKAEYKLDEATGEYTLDAEGVPDVTGLRKKVDELLDERKADQRRAREEAEKRARAEGDLAALETSLTDRFNTDLAARDADIAARDGLLARLTVGRTANDLAKELAVDAEAVPALLPHITGRLRMELVNGDAVIRVLDAEGKASALTLDQLREEFKANPAFKRLIAGSKASGGGADGGKEGGGGATKPLAEMGDAERTEWAKRDPEGFARAVEAAKAKK